MNKLYSELEGLLAISLTSKSLSFVSLSISKCELNLSFDLKLNTLIVECKRLSLEGTGSIGILNINVRELEMSQQC